MTTAKIDPGVCGLVTSVSAQSEDGMEVKLIVKSGCEPIRNMFKELGDTFNAFELCLVKPGENCLYEYAQQNFPAHASCPSIAGILKAIEVECSLALPKNVAIEITKE